MTDFDKGYEQGRKDENARILDTLLSLCDGKNDEVIDKLHKAITEDTEEIEMQQEDLIDKELRKALMNLQNARTKANVTQDEIESLHRKIMYWNNLKKGNK